MCSLNSSINNDLDCKGLGCMQWTENRVNFMSAHIEDNDECAMVHSNSAQNAGLAGHSPILDSVNR